LNPGLQDLKKRIAEATPEINRHGVHLRGSCAGIYKNNAGAMLLRDSHEYDAEPRQEVDIFVAPGEEDMTLLFGLAKQLRQDRRPQDLAEHT